MYSRKSPQITEWFILTVMCKKKSWITAVCALPSTTQTTLVQAEPEQQLQKRAECKLPLKITDWKLFTGKKYIATPSCRSPNANTSWTSLNAFNINLVYKRCLYDLSNSMYSKEGISTQEGFTDFWQIQTELKYNVCNQVWFKNIMN